MPLPVGSVFVVIRPIDIAGAVVIGNSIAMSNDALSRRLRAMKGSRNKTMH